MAVASRTRSNRWPRHPWNAEPQVRAGREDYRSSRFDRERDQQLVAAVRAMNLRHNQVFGPIKYGVGRLNKTEN
jgi:hypothetical protein